MAEITMLQAALSYAKGQGHRHPMSVFPAIPATKSPYTGHGFKDASADELTIKKWWSRWPKANVAIPTGRVNGILVIDFDNIAEEGIDAMESLSALETKYGELPETWVEITGRGGYHYYFKYPEGHDIRDSETKLYDHVDIRANGGYVVVAPSVHANGHKYVWELEHAPCDLPLADLPDSWIWAIESSAITVTSDGTDGFVLPETIPEGTRDDTIFKYACSLRAKGRKASQILDALRTVNKERCIPPLKDDEVVAKFDSALKYDYEPKAKRQYTFPTAGTATAPEAADMVEAIEKVRPADFSDVGNATVLEIVSGSDMRWTAGLGWLVWNGTVWARSHDQLARGKVRWLTDVMLADALKAVNDAVTVDGSKAQIPEKEKEYLKHAQRSRSVSKIDAMLSVAQTALYAEASMFDANPWDLNTPEGIVDLRTGEIRDHDRLAYCTKCTKVSPSKESGERWTDFLNMITEGNQDLLTYLQYFAGMCAVGTVTQEGVLIANGGGSNGKSTFFNALSAVMGDYATSIDVTTLTTDRQNRGASLATLRGARLVTCGELEEGQRLSIQTLKRVASTDPITIEEKYRAPETIIPTHHICLFTNHLPKVGSTDNGTWRRLIVAPFNATMPTGENRIPNYARHLAEEDGPAILQWIIDGAIMFHANGDRLISCQEVEDATAEYREREDWLKCFMDECCIIEDEASVRCGILFNAYKEYAEANGDFARRRIDFNSALEAAGFKQRTPGHHQYYWQGLKLNPEYIGKDSASQSLASMASCADDIVAILASYCYESRFEHLRMQADALEDKLKSMGHSKTAINAAKDSLKNRGQIDFVKSESGQWLIGASNDCVTRWAQENPENPWVINLKNAATETQTAEKVK